MIRRCLCEGTEFGVVILLEGNALHQPGETELLSSTGTIARIELCEAPIPAHRAPVAACLRSRAGRPHPVSPK